MPRNPGLTRKAFGSATLATSAVASAGPTPGRSSSRLLVSFERCQAGLDPAIHPFRKKMDARVKPRVKPAHDVGEQRFNSSGIRYSLIR